MRKKISVFLVFCLAITLLFVRQNIFLAASTVNSTAELKTAIANNENILIASSFEVNETIHIPSTYNGTISGENHTLSLSNQQTNMFVIDGTVVMENLQLDGKSFGRLIVANSATLQFRRVTFKNGLSWREEHRNHSSISEGGAIFASQSQLTFENSSFINNVAVTPNPQLTNVTNGNGGAIYVKDRSTVTMNESTITNNHSGKDSVGGFLASFNSSITVKNSTFTGNHNAQVVDLQNQGGVFFLRGSTLQSNNNVYNVSGPFNTGGAIYSHTSTLNSVQDQFKMADLGDRYGISGGAIAAEGSTVSIQNGDFNVSGKSKVAFAGGVIDFVHQNDVTITNSNFVGRGKGQGISTATYGGAIAFETGASGTATIIDSTFNHFSADITGGAIAISTNKNENAKVNLTLRNTTIENTQTFHWGDQVGGAIFVGPGNTLFIDKGTISNTSAGFGGAIYNQGNTTITNQSNITGNFALQLGGGIYNDGILKLDEMNLDAYFVGGAHWSGNPYPGYAHEYGGINVYAAKDVIITPNANISPNKDIRVIDGVSKIKLTAPLVNPIYVTISEESKPNTLENNIQRHIGYVVAAGTDNYTATNVDAQKLHYLSKVSTTAPTLHQQPVAEIDDHQSIGKWDYLLNPETKNIVLGQRVKMIYDANSGVLAGNGNALTSETTIDVYKKDQTGITKNNDLNPIKNQFTFVDWYNENVKTEVQQLPTPNTHATDKFKFTSINLSPEDTRILNPNVFKAFAGYTSPQKNITHRFKKDDAVTIRLPNEILSRTNHKDLFNVVNGQVYTPNATIDTTAYNDTNHDGVWQFSGWTPASITVSDTSVNEFVGVWTFEKNQYKVTHVFDKKEGIKQELPQAIKDRVLGKDITGKVNGDNVQPDPMIDTNDYVDTVNDGVWQFSGWTPTSITINKKDEVLTGTWEFVANTYQVTHVFDKKEGIKQELPQAIKDRVLGKDITGKVNGDNIQPDPTIDTIDYIDTVNDGVWQFSGWTPTSITINKKDEVLIGTWEFVANTYQVTHVFDKKEGIKQELPQAIKDRVLGKDITGKVNGDNVQPDPTIDTNDYVDTVNDGVWQFVGWAPTSITINKKDEVLTGTWEFVANTYQVTHVFDKKEGIKQELPQAIKDRVIDKQMEGKVTGEVVQPDRSIDISDYFDAVNVGIWRFEKWTPTSIKIERSSIIFEGIWTFQSTKSPILPDVIQPIPPTHPQTKPPVNTYDDTFVYWLLLVGTVLIKKRLKY